MKIITYQCDYCKKNINADKEPVLAIRQGRICRQDEFVPDQDAKIKHYHDYCLTYLMVLNPDTSPKSSGDDDVIAGLEPEETDPEEAKPEEAPKPKNKGGRKPSIDVGKLRSLVAAGWKFDQIMLEDEFKNRDPSGIRRWIKKIEEEMNGGMK